MLVNHFNSLSVVMFERFCSVSVSHEMCYLVAADPSMPYAFLVSNLSTSSLRTRGACYTFLSSAGVNRRSFYLARHGCPTATRTTRKLHRVPQTWTLRLIHKRPTVLLCELSPMFPEIYISGRVPVQYLVYSICMPPAYLTSFYIPLFG